MSKPVFGRGGRRKRRRHRVVPPRGANALWPLTHEEVAERRRMAFLVYYGAAARFMPMLFRGRS